MKRFFTSESVTEGHPDKVCDQISDAVLDSILAVAPESRVACETAVTTGMVLVMGEVSTSATLDIPSIVRDTVKEIGYVNPESGFDYRSCSVLVTLDRQSADIALGVDSSLEDKASDSQYDKIGAGDQGMMFGFACNETEELMPMPITLAHKLSHKLTEVRKSGALQYLRPDGKSQVTIEYDGNKVKRVDTVVLSTQHSEEISIDELRSDLKELVIKAVIPAELMDSDTKIYINPTGRFVIGGPQGDSGLTGRKIIVDTYGGYAPHGGGAFSGKDPTKVDRSAAYYARYVAKNIVASGLAEKCELQLAYAIGKAQPVSILVNTFGTGKLADDVLVEALPTIFDFRPKAIIDALDLTKPQYRKTASYGHFGRDCFSWEKTDKIAELKRLI